jgi:hypothetical protein
MRIRRDRASPHGGWAALCDPLVITRRLGTRAHLFMRSRTGGRSIMTRPNDASIPPYPRTERCSYGLSRVNFATLLADQ